MSRFEVLVAAAVFVVLTVCVLPAIQSAREVARRQACTDNLFRIGEALGQYHDTHGQLPSAAIWTAAGFDVSTFLHHLTDSVPITHQNWVMCLLPYVGENELRSKWNMRLPMLDEQNELVRESELILFHCSSDSFNRPDNHYLYEGPNGARARFARGNYAINAGSHWIKESPGILAMPVVDGVEASSDKKSRSFQMWGNGVAGVNKAFSFKEFANGLSTTVAVDEIRAGIDPIDPRGVWSLGQIGGSITWAHGVLGDAGGPNPTLPHADDILRGGDLNDKVGRDRLKLEGMTACDHVNKNDQASARSQHPAGVNVLMADGATRFVNNQVDPAVWQLIHCRLTPRQILGQIAESFPPAERKEAAPPTPPESVATKAVTHSTKGEFEVTNSIGMRFKTIPAGSFIMGLADAANTNALPVECPAHTVRLSKPFLIGVHEVTQEQFSTVTRKNPSWFSVGAGGETELVQKDTRRCPVENVSWDEAAEFCRELSNRPQERAEGRWYRLPTEAEWEYCCRAGTSEPFHFDKKYDESGEIGGKGWHEPPLTPAPVGSYRPNALGLYDMRGNVWEWCSDWFARDYYSWSPAADPQGPATGFLKVYRGTDWIFTADFCKTRSLTAAPWQRNRFIGFRVVCVIDSSQKNR